MIDHFKPVQRPQDGCNGAGVLPPTVANGYFRLHFFLLFVTAQRLRRFARVSSGCRRANAVRPPAPTTRRETAEFGKPWELWHSRLHPLLTGRLLNMANRGNSGTLACTHHSPVDC